jgi:hypothetical protein
MDDATIIALQDAEYAASLAADEAREARETASRIWDSARAMTRASPVGPTDPTDPADPTDPVDDRPGSPGLSPASMRAHRLHYFDHAPATSVGEVAKVSEVSTAAMAVDCSQSAPGPPIRAPQRCSASTKRGAQCKNTGALLANGGQYLCKMHLTAHNAERSDGEKNTAHICKRTKRVK